MADAFQSPGLTIEEVETLVANATGLDTGTTAELTRIDQAITLAGQFACTCEGRSWWFLWADGTFDTVASTASYDLRTVNSNDMEDILVPVRVWRSTTPLTPMSFLAYRDLTRSQSTVPTGAPDSYAIDGDLTMYLYETPDDAYTMYVDYYKRHSKVTNTGSTDAALIIPAEFQFGIYVSGAEWLLRHENIDPSSLLQCEPFLRTIERMDAAQPASYRASPELVFPGGKHGSGFLPDGDRLIWEDN
ncbi:MAG: hypothetical protein KGY81_08100 [Phycisphaerae bacterium]|nr:hypothetical protein [Phycisphaerae bacterium]